ncbi:MAG: hypothetical protein R3E53_09270 [Myxococcota bacterium]
MTSSPAGVLLEEIAGWLREVLDPPADSVGAVTTGATVANFTALAAARHHLLEAQGWDVEADGLFGAPPLRVLLRPSRIRSSARRSGCSVSGATGSS